MLATILPKNEQQWENLRKLMNATSNLFQPQKDLGDFFAINAPHHSLDLLFPQEKDADKFGQNYALIYISPDVDLKRRRTALISRPFDASTAKAISIEEGHSIAVREHTNSREGAFTLVIDKWSDLGSLENYFRNAPVSILSIENLIHFVRDSLMTEHGVAEEIVEGFAGSHLGFAHALGFQKDMDLNIEFTGIEGALIKFYPAFTRQFPPIFRPGVHALRKYREDLVPPFNIVSAGIPRFEGVSPLYNDEGFPIRNFEDVPFNRVHVGIRRTDNHRLYGPILQASLATPFLSELEYHKETCDQEDLLQLLALRAHAIQPPTTEKFQRKAMPWLESFLGNFPMNTPEMRQFIMEHSELNESYYRTLEARVRLDRGTLDDEGLQDHANLTFNRLERNIEALIDLDQKRKDPQDRKRAKHNFKRAEKWSSPEMSKAYNLQDFFTFVRRIPEADLVAFMQQNYNESNRSIKLAVDKLISRRFFRREGQYITWGGRSI